MTHDELVAAVGVDQIIVADAVEEGEYLDALTVLEHTASMVRQAEREREQAAARAAATPT